jgi:uncharacterized protein involved in exopolysaccharide biosynthesis
VSYYSNSTPAPLDPRAAGYDRFSTGGPAGGSAVGLRGLFDILGASKWFIITAAVVVSLGSFTAALIVPKSYEATVVLAPISSRSGVESLSNSISSQLEGLSDLVGMPYAAATRKAESAAFLLSDALTEKYIHDNNLLPILYESLWDASARRWRVSDPTKIPTLWRANELFKKTIRTVKIDPMTGYVTMTIVWKDPRLAATWANGLATMANDFLRDQAAADSERNIAYLTKEVLTADVVQTRQVIYSILRTEISRRMLAKGTEDYAFKIIDPAMVVEKPAHPKPVGWWVAGLLAGLYLSCCLVTLRAALR